MLTSKGIFWLSSYPKSGNTWFRLVLSRLLNTSPNLNYINDIDTILGCGVVTNRHWTNKLLGFDSSLLNDDEIDQLRPDAYQWYAQQVNRTNYIKIHDAYSFLPDNRPLIPAEGCLGVIYFVRNPLDVAVSLAHHANCSIDWSIHMMGNQEFSVPVEKNKDKQLRQKLLTWSGHVESWTRTSALRTLVIRYEDMYYNPLETFAKGLDFLNIDVSNTIIEETINANSFDRLQQHEKKYGFKEKPPIKGQFFRKGIVGDWKNTLNDAQVEKIIHDHGDVMQTHGYTLQE